VTAALRQCLHQNNRGFLLMEVLLVVVIIAVGLTTVISSLSMSLRGIAYVRDYTQAVLLLDNKIGEILLAPQALGDQRGRFERPDENFHYRIKEQDFDPPTLENLEGLREIEVEVSWPAGKTEKKIQATLLTRKDQTTGLP